MDGVKWLLATCLFGYLLWHTRGITRAVSTLGALMRIDIDEIREVLAALINTNKKYDKAFTEIGNQIGSIETSLVDIDRVADETKDKLDDIHSALDKTEQRISNLEN